MNVCAFYPHFVSGSKLECELQVCLVILKSSVFIHLPPTRCLAPPPPLSHTPTSVLLASFLFHTSSYLVSCICDFLRSCFQITTDLRHRCTDSHTGTSASAPMAAAIIALALEAK